MWKATSVLALFAVLFGGGALSAAHEDENMTTIGPITVEKRCMQAFSIMPVLRVSNCIHRYFWRGFDVDTNTNNNVWMEWTDFSREETDYEGKPLGTFDTIPANLYLGGVCDRFPNRGGSPVAIGNVARDGNKVSFSVSTHNGGYRLYFFLFPSVDIDLSKDAGTYHATLTANFATLPVSLCEHSYWYTPPLPGGGT